MARQAFFAVVAPLASSTLAQSEAFLPRPVRLHTNWSRRSLTQSRTQAPYSSKDDFEMIVNEGSSGDAGSGGWSRASPPEAKEDTELVYHAFGSKSAWSDLLDFLGISYYYTDGRNQATSEIEADGKIAYKQASGEETLGMPSTTNGTEMGNPNETAVEIHPSPRPLNTTESKPSSSRIINPRKTDDSQKGKDLSAQADGQEHEVVDVHIGGCSSASSCPENDREPSLGFLGSQGLHGAVVVLLAICAGCTGCGIILTVITGFVALARRLRLRLHIYGADEEVDGPPSLQLQNLAPPELCEAATPTWTPPKPVVILGPDNGVLVGFEVKPSPSPLQRATSCDEPTIEVGVFFRSPTNPGGARRMLRRDALMSPLPRSLLSRLPPDTPPNETPARSDDETGEAHASPAQSMLPGAGTLNV